MERMRPNEGAKGSITRWAKDIRNATREHDGEQETGDPEDEGDYQGAVNNASRGDDWGEG